MFTLLYSRFYVLCIMLFATFLSGTMPIYCLNVLHPLIQWHTFKSVMACLGKSIVLLFLALNFNVVEIASVMVDLFMHAHIVMFTRIQRSSSTF